MSVIQIILILFAAFGFAAAAMRYKRRESSFGQLMLWALLWIGVAYVVLRPETASDIARRLGVGRGADVVIYLSIVVIFYLLFRMFARIEAQDRQITRLTRELALKDLDEPHGR